MLRRTIQSSFFKRSYLHHQCSLSSGPSPLLIQNRCFFFGSGGNGDDDDSKKDGKDKKGDEDKKDPADEKEEDKDGDVKDTTEVDSEPSATLNNSSKYKTFPRTGGGNPNVMLPANRLGFGDQAPRYPHLMALPVIRGPVFPGVLTPLTVTDKVRCSV